MKLVRRQTTRRGGVMIGLGSRPNLLKQLAVLAGEVNFAQLLKQLPSSHLSSAIGPPEIGGALGMQYPHERAHGLEPAASELGSKVAAKGAGDAEDGQ